MKHWLRSIALFVVAFGLLLAPTVAFAVEPLNLRDVSTSDPDYEALRYLNAHDVIYGYLTGNIYPDRTITRAELLKIAIEGSGKGVDALSYGRRTTTFSDVPDDYSLRAYVIYASDNGYVSGYPDGSFRPNANVTRAEAAKVLANILGACSANQTTPYTDIDTSTLKPSIEQLYKLDWFRPIGSSFYPNSPALRREVARIAYRSIHSTVSDTAGCRRSYVPSLSDDFATNSDWQVVGAMDGRVAGTRTPGVSVPAGWLYERVPDLSSVSVGPTKTLAREQIDTEGALISVERRDPRVVNPSVPSDPREYILLFRMAPAETPTATLNRVAISGGRTVDVYERVDTYNGQKTRKICWKADVLHCAVFNEWLMPSQLGVFYRLVQNAVYLSMPSTSE